MADRFKDLTQRQQDMIHILAQFTIENPATVADISKELHISSRTVLRELPLLEQWLIRQEMNLFRKPGVGMAIDATPAQRQSLFEARPRESAVSARPERRRCLMAQLLSAQEPIKALSLAKDHQISEGTLSADLDYISDLLALHKVRLHRKSGVGMYVSGSEAHLRHAMAAVVFDWMQDDAVASLFLWRKDTAPQSASFGLWRLIDPQHLGAIHQALTAAAQIHATSYTDRGYLSLMVFVSIAIKRRSAGYSVDQAPAAPPQPMAHTIANALDMVDWSQEELSHLAVELSGDLTPAPHETDAWDSIQVRQLILQLIQQVHQTAQTTFHQDELLISDLVNHTLAAVKRLQLGVWAKNNHAQELQAAYPAIYQATLAACTLLEAPADLSPIPESEVALIAMHFCAAHERAKDSLRQVEAVIACPMGMGMSRILAANLKKAFPQLHINDVVSVMALDIEKLEEHAIDLVVSTVMIDLDFPCICVTPALLPQDKLHLMELCNQIGATPPKQAKGKRRGPALLETIAYVQDLGQGISRLLRHIPLEELEQADSKDHLLQQAAALFPEGNARQLLQDLTAREAISETYIDQGQTLLLHCKTTGIDTCRFGYIRLGSPLSNGDNLVSGAIVMVAPTGGSQIHVEMMGHICSAFLNNEALYQAAQHGTQQELATQIQEILGLFYTNTLHLI